MTRRRRILRRSVDVVCVVGMLLFLGLWMRTTSRDDSFVIWSEQKPFEGTASCIAVITRNGSLCVGWTGYVKQRSPLFNALYNDFGRPIGWVWSKSVPRTFFKPDVFGDIDGRWTDGQKWISLPYWLLILLFLILPSLHLFAYIRHRRSIPKGHVLCSNCGYDLFGSQGETCPECGAAVAEAK